MTREFIRLPEFEKQCSLVGLDDGDVREIELALLANPSVGKVMVGTGGIRKTRIPLPNRGKSGGARVIYIDFAFCGTVYFITLYDKGDTESLTMAEKNELKVLAGILKSELRKKAGK